MERYYGELKGDFKITSGVNKGKRVDFMFTFDSEKGQRYLNKDFENQLGPIRDSLQKHLELADIVPLDFRNLEVPNQAHVIGILNSLPASLSSKALIIQ